MGGHGKALTGSFAVANFDRASSPVRGGKDEDPISKVQPIFTNYFPFSRRNFTVHFAAILDAV
jgi:hypothetical protein